MLPSRRQVVLRRRVFEGESPQPLHTRCADAGYLCDTSRLSQAAVAAASEVVGTHVVPAVSSVMLSGGGVGSNQPTVYRGVLKNSDIGGGGGGGGGGGDRSGGVGRGGGGSGCAPPNRLILRRSDGQPLF